MVLDHGWKSLYSSGFIRHPFLSIMADECTDVTTIEELTICCCWVESGVPEEQSIEILHLEKANAESIYSALVEYCREMNIQLGRLIGMRFYGTAFSLVTKQSGGSRGVFAIALCLCTYSC